jgi:anti-sigma factor ChrR (cupin superfamily)
MQRHPEDECEADKFESNGVVVINNLLEEALHPARLWEDFQVGVEISRVYTVEQGMASAFLRFTPESRLPRHCHVGYEHIFVLRGSQQDENGVHRAGTMLLHPPGTCHTVSSSEGCLVFAIWEKPVSFLALDVGGGLVR